MYIRGFDLASDTQAGCYIRGFDLQHTSSGGFMHEVLISLLAWRRELIHEVCIFSDVRNPQNEIKTS